MDPALAGLAAAAATALVQAVTKDGWEAAKARLAAILHRHGADDPAVAAHLDRTEDRLLGAPQPAGAPGLVADGPAAAEERLRWALLLAAFLAEHEAAAADLRRFADDLRPPAGDGSVVVQQVAAGRDAYTAGRDQHVRPRPAAGAGDVC
ncbi:hypothetical protein Sru01_34960 [Sphaerisporangium rufum]|uniref:Uncharacterized protein n=1 Tax=Sphaerisporangium rufum TaxID=1381558 RepID=A0A919R2Q8_9ACTN|nr:hypothetical protein [Sphaerisporangium rufum]GII78514.1 hypothetical protein Sru01_34960 [Sphaerisporangium rufum]